MKLVARDGKQVPWPVAKVNRDLAHRLHTINMKDRVGVFADYAPNFVNRKQHSSFVVREHYRNDSCIAAQSFPQVVEIKFAVMIDFQPGYFATSLCQMFAEISHRFVLDSGRNN